MKPINIPVVSAPLGPGSQDLGEDDGLEYMDMPNSMDTFSAPLIPEPEDLKGKEAAQEVLQAVRQTLQRNTDPNSPHRYDLAHLDAACHEVLNQMLGEGEVSIVFDLGGSERIDIQESVFAGLWRVAHHNGQQLLQDYLETGAIPEIIQHAWEDMPAAPVPEQAENLPEGVMNAPAVLVEVADKSRGWQAGDKPHVLNLSLLPQTPQDLEYLQAHMGTGRVTVLSRGYGNCRITSSAWPQVWWVQYFNSNDTLILNTLEVTGIPLAACASQEDLEDTCTRLNDLLGYLEQQA